MSGSAGRAGVQMFVDRRQRFSQLGGSFRIATFNGGEQGFVRMFFRRQAVLVTQMPEQTVANARQDPGGVSGPFAKKSCHRLDMLFDRTS